MTVRTFGARIDEPNQSEQHLPGSPDLRKIVNPSIGSWIDYRKTLLPNYRQAWGEITFCMSSMIAGFVAHIYLTRVFGNAFGLKIGVFFALWIGFWLNSILTFGHEAAHYNLSAKKKRNDLLADWTIWLFFPQTTSAYRKSHWQHHLHLGDPKDTEISYHNCLSPWFLLKTLTGLYLITLVVRYVFHRGVVEPPANRMVTSESNGVMVLPLLRTLATHSIFVGVALTMRSRASALVWICAVIFVFPFFASMRQVLEHRAADARCETDFGRESQGPVNRIFGKDFVSRYFGAAGFNRHLLHHWDPTVSYTRFDEMQLFLNETDLRFRIELAQSNYLSTLSALIRRAVRDDQ